MSKTLPLDEMSTEEKIQTMEHIWDDLVSNADNIASPEWHGDILSDRDIGVKNGSEEIFDWSVARNKIKKDIS